MLFRMHRRRPDFDPLKFTPSIIHNRLDLPILEVIEYFKTHSLSECAFKFGCSLSTIKRKLKTAGVNTAIHNHSQFAKNKAFTINSKIKPSPDEIYSLYIEDNLDAKSIAELYGLHYNTIRSYIKKLGLQKSLKLIAKSMENRHLAKHGVRHPSQRPDVIKKTSVSLNKVAYRGHKFKSITELGYALYLDNRGLEWYYEEMHIPYVDMLTGKRRIYVIDFTVVDNDKISWIEIKPDNAMIPEDKRVYASRRAEEAGVIFRGISEYERNELWKLIIDGYNFEEVEFIQRTPRSTSTKITYYFKSEQAAVDFNLDGWRQFTKPSNNGALWKKTLVRK